MESMFGIGARPARVARVVFMVLVLAQLAYVRSTFPSLEEYYPGADEGTYFRQASTILDGGPAGFRTLGRAFLADPLIQSNPPPTRIGHLLLAASALSFDRSLRALSTLSFVSFALLCALIFVFVRRHWNEAAAMAAALLVAAAPLGAGLSRRALTDSDHALFFALSTVLLFAWIVRPRDRTFAWFLVALSWTALLKEATLFLLPAYAVALAYMRLRGIGDVRVRHLLLLGVVPLAVMIAEAIAFGPAQAVAMVTTIRQMNTYDTTRYLRDYQAGPWFTEIVGLFLLAPLTSLVFLLSCGWLLQRLRSEPVTSILIVWLAAAFVCLAALPQNPRWAGPIDPFARVVVAIAIAGAASSSLYRARWAVATAAVLTLTAVDVMSFRQLFVEHAIYDPVLANLVAARRMVPTGPTARQPPTAEAYVDLSLAYYRVRDFRAAIAMAERALALRSDSAEAYNNLGASYCELGHWNEAAAALEHAVALDPGLAIARNNLAWARGELDKQGTASR
jgi:hypothetical protein